MKQKNFFHFKKKLVLYCLPYFFTIFLIFFSCFCFLFFKIDLKYWIFIIGKIMLLIFLSHFFTFRILHYVRSSALCFNVKPLAITKILFKISLFMTIPGLFVFAFIPSFLHYTYSITTFIRLGFLLFYLLVSPFIILFYFNNVYINTLLKTYSKIPTIQFLITTLNKQEDEIIDLVLRSNLFGHVIVGNQNNTSDEIKNLLLPNGVELTIVNQISKGVSLNRNTIFKYSSADFVFFLDDDCIIERDFYYHFLNALKAFPKAKAIHFNVRSLNKDRPILIKSICRRITFFDVRSYGVWSTAFNRKMLIDKHLTFDEDIGPGRLINFGEDVLFMHTFFDFSNEVYFSPYCMGVVCQKESTWFNGYNENFFIYTSFMYHKLFRSLAFLFFLYTLIKHRKKYLQNFTIKQVLQWFIQGRDKVKKKS